MAIVVPVRQPRMSPASAMGPLCCQEDRATRRCVRSSLVFSLVVKAGSPVLVSTPVSGPSMIRVCAPEVSRSTADWASSASLIMVSHSDGSRFEVRIVLAQAVAFHDDFVEVVGFGGVEGFERKVVEDQQVDAGEPAEFGVEGVVQPGGAEPGEQLVGACGVHGQASSDRDVAEPGGNPVR